MPGLKELEQLSSSYSLALALLIIAAISLTYALIRLYRENGRLYERIQALLEKRIEVLEGVLGRRTHVE
jgi:membrane protein implicated in regulation of membrane protease activity